MQNTKQKSGNKQKLTIAAIFGAMGPGLLAALSGKVHFVHTGVCVVRGGESLSRTFTTKVFFRPLKRGEIDAYLAEESVLDKAGAYAIQGPAAKFVTGIEGCFFNVVGLPVSGLYGMLGELGAV